MQDKLRKLVALALSMRHELRKALEPLSPRILAIKHTRDSEHRL
jgi:hypothetical protein